jgi:hypothetical protein
MPLSFSQTIKGASEGSNIGGLGCGGGGVVLIALIFIAIDKHS